MNLKNKIFFILIAIVISIFLGCVEKPEGISIKIDDVSVEQTSKYTKVIVNGEEYGIKPGILLIYITASITNTGGSTVELRDSDIVVKNYGTDLKSLTLSYNGKEVSSLSIPPKKIIPVKITVSYDGGPPFKLQLLMFDELIDLENLQPQKERFSVMLNSDIEANLSSVKYNDINLDSVKFTLKIKNNGRINWTVNLEDVIVPTDIGSYSYGLARENQDCPCLTIKEYEEKEVDFLFITKKMDSGFNIVLRSPFKGTIEIPENRMKIEISKIN
ncbi:MAG: hypothetical protein Q7J35_18300 [Candidatus Methanoperedens sp.]|nr:hypothetical protein [Candidatus Methanoperedens sp.]